MALNEYESGVLNCLSELEYNYTSAGTTTQRQWVVELGRYMRGEFNRSDPEWKALMKQWHTVCLQSPHPLELTISAEADFPPERKTIVLACPLDSSRVSGENVSDLVKNYSKPPGTNPQAIGRSPPYYATEPQTKICGAAGGCTMWVKIYY